MWSKFKNWIIGGVSSIIFSFGYDWIKDKPLLSTAKTVLLGIWSLLIYLLKTELKVWWLLIFLIFAKIVQMVVNNSQKEPPKPEHANYKKDRFKNWIWRWDWYYNNNTQEWTVFNLKAYCPKDDVELMNKSDILESKAVCPKCDKWYTGYNQDIEDSKGTLTLILDNVRKNKYSIDN